MSIDTVLSIYTVPFNLIPTAMDIFTWFLISLVISLIGGFMISEVCQDCMRCKAPLALSVLVGVILLVYLLQLILGIAPASLLELPTDIFRTVVFLITILVLGGVLLGVSETKRRIT